MRTFVRRGTTALLLGLSALGVGATPTMAARTTPYVAAFPREVTISTGTVCPPGAPTVNVFCFRGEDTSGQGTSVPPGGSAKEEFVGWVDLGSPIANACPGGQQGFPDHNIVTITTRAGQLFATTDGTACGLGQPTSTDVGTWAATGGTGIFTGARGGGRVATSGTAPDATGAIASSSGYVGSLTLR